jgi:uncharacterized protein YqgV (UPF0045/DUF77 family)
MDIGVEISLYPLNEQFIPPISDFIARVNKDGRFRVVTNSLSTQLFGEYDALMEMLAREIRTTFEGGEKSVFVMKVIGPYEDPA